LAEFARLPRGCMRLAIPPAEKVSDLRRDRRMVRLERKVSRVKEFDVGVRVIALEHLGACRQKERVVLAPYGERRWLPLAEIFLELRVQRDIAGVVQEKVELDLGVPLPS